MRLVFATRNPDKLAELAHVLAGLPIEIRCVADYPGIPEIEESGTTLEENALLKARGVQRAVGETCLADDTGLEVDALDGAPGVHSARYAGPQGDYARNLERLLHQLTGVPVGRRTARFRTVIALVHADGSECLAEGVCHGRILAAPRGSGGFGYDPVFFVPEIGRTFAELTLEEKSHISHRGSAMRAVRRILAGRLARGSQSPPGDRSPL